MAVPQQRLQQLLALDEAVRLEIAHTLERLGEQCLHRERSRDLEAGVLARDRHG